MQNLLHIATKFIKISKKISFFAKITEKSPIKCKISFCKCISTNFELKVQNTFGGGARV